jgi:hypothetical protein
MPKSLIGLMVECLRLVAYPDGVSRHHLERSTMSATHRIGILLLVGLAFILGSVWQLAGAQVEKATAVQKWEYKRMSAGSSLGQSDQEALNKAGEEGWEVASAFSWGREGSVSVLILKRPKQ